VWVHGRHLLKDRALTTIDLAQVLQKTSAWQQQIREKAE
jgi:hypothetical protein